jgi:hypothetical protein
VLALRYYLPISDPLQGLLIAAPAAAIAAVSALMITGSGRAALQDLRHFGSLVSTGSSQA